MNTLQKFRKKPVVITAIQWKGDNLKAIENFGGMGVFPSGSASGLKIGVRTLEGTMYASIDDWIIMGIKGELYPCKPDIFEATYELVEEEQN